MEFNPGLDIGIEFNPMNFIYGKNMTGPIPEIRYLKDIRGSLAEPDCVGPDQLYCIAMDVAEKEDHRDLINRNLLYGVVSYSAGQLGSEPIRSQGHIHAISKSCNSSTCEVYEIWDGEAYIYMQESGEDNPGKCYAVYAKASDVVIVPPGWVHATVNANVNKNMVFGAWCVRDYGFDYRAVKAHHGIAFFPKVQGDKIIWEENPHYVNGSLTVKSARIYEDFGLKPGISIYEQYQINPSLFEFVPQPQCKEKEWGQYEP
ncbi:MAG: glucose-6-phosphate isomerase [Herbinix sp.]|jgi:glucose-6-phosphate isomerase|nr:glucose-6-phosphate isomerase [Herbinix sp.]